MAKNWNDLLEKITLNPMLQEMEYKYRNDVILGGFILKKPKFFHHDTLGVDSCSFNLYQLVNKMGKLRLESFNCMTYVKDLIEQLKKQNKVIMVITVGKMRYSPKTKDHYSQVVEMETFYELEERLVGE